MSLQFTGNTSNHNLLPDSVAIETVVVQPVAMEAINVDEKVVGGEVAQIYQLAGLSLEDITLVESREEDDSVDSIIVRDVIAKPVFSVTHSSVENIDFTMKITGVPSQIGVDTVSEVENVTKKTSPAYIILLKEVQSCNSVEGGAAKFSCSITGYPIPDVCWYKDGKRLDESREYSMLVGQEHQHVLILTNCHLDSQGTYTCIGTNSTGSVRSSGKLSVESWHDDDDDDEAGDMMAGQQCDEQCEKGSIDIKKANVEDYFTLKEELGSGKFGTVYKCLEKHTGKEYAAKFIKCRPRQRKVVINEINMLNALNHKSIVRIVGAFDYSRHMVLVMELVSGGELFERLMEEEVISEMDVTFYIKQLLHAIQHMHNLGILHLDLKPENIMLVNKNSTQIKLIDFGLACRVSEGESVKVLCGTAEFISPEVLNYEPVSTATDMWSVGVIAYVLLSGFSPFLGETDAETLANITRGEWDFDDEDGIFDEITNEAKDFISKLLMKNEKERATVEECLQHMWLTVTAGCKNIKTQKLSSYLIKRKWRKGIAAIRTTGILAKLGGRTSGVENLNLNE